MPAGSLVLHIDGGESAAKGIEHRKRQLKREKACTRLGAGVRSLKKKKAAGERPTMKLEDSIEKDLKSAFQLTKDHKNALNDSLKRLGLESHVCHGEADPCLAESCRRFADSQASSKMAIVTKDSDLLAYHLVDAVLRPNPKDSGFILYEKEKVMNVLGFRHRLFMTLFAIGLSNDYAHNVKTIGPATNLKIVKAVQRRFFPDLTASAASGSSQSSSARHNETAASSSTSLSIVEASQIKDDSSNAGASTLQPAAAPQISSKKHGRDELQEQPSKKGRQVPEASQPFLQAPAATSSQSLLSSMSSQSVQSLASSQSAPSSMAGFVTPVQVPGLRILLQLWCQEASAHVKKNVQPDRFEPALRTFGFYSQLCIGETPESNPGLIPLYEAPTQQTPVGRTWQDDDPAVEPDIKMTPQQLASKYMEHLSEYVRLSRQQRPHVPPSQET